MHDRFCSLIGRRSTLVLGVRRLTILSAMMLMPCVATDLAGQQIQPAGYSSPGTGLDSWSNGNGNWNAGWGSGWNTGNGGGWNTGNATPKAWKLGVTGSNTEIGVTLNSVAPNSPAARAGLTVGDLIVCVNGNQVGLVGSKVFDIGETMNQQADSMGRVSTLAYQRRTGQLRLLQIQLEDQQGGLTGNLFIRNGTVPVNSIVTVQLENVTRPYYVVRNGQTTFRTQSITQGSIPFSLNYDPSYLSTGDTYRLRAYVTYNGSTILDTAQPQFVLTQGNPNRVDLYLTPASFAFSNTPGTGNTSGSTVAGYGNQDNVSQQITAAYQRYLGRYPTTTELAAWQQMPDVRYRLTNLPIQFLGSQEYYDRTGNNNLVWLERVFTEMVGRAPSSAELDQWNRRFADVRYSRTEILNEFAEASRR